MKNFIIFMIFFMGLPCLWAQKKTTVALLDLTVSQSLPSGIGNVLGMLIRQEFVRSDQYDILDRSNMEAILKEQNFILSDNCNSRECAVQIGQLLGVDKMLFGDIGTLGKKVIINLQLVDVATAKIERVLTETHVGEIEDLDAPVIRLARKMAGIEVKEKEESHYQVYITSEPEGASIYIGNEIRGTTPVTLNFRNDEPVRLYVKAENYQDWYQEIRPKKNEKVIVNAKLIAGKSGKKASGQGMSADEFKARYEIFDSRKKSHRTALALSFFLGSFGAGHFYAHSISRGVLVLGTSATGVVIAINSIKNDKSASTGLAFYFGAYLYDIVGAQLAVISYNEKLKKELKIAIIPEPVKKGGQIRFAVHL